MILEIGGGTNPRYRPNLDIRPGPTVDIVSDLNKPLPLSNDCYEHVYSAYAIEHIGWRNVKAFIRELHRILKPNGTCLVVTANLLEQCRKLVETKEWNDDLIGMVFGGQDYNENSHSCGFSPDYAIKLFREAGFSGVSVRPLNPEVITDMIIEARK
jgi:SAM-dependent methyltransferase